jgi:hypothetical protein
VGVCAYRPTRYREVVLTRPKYGAYGDLDTYNSPRAHINLTAA